MAAVPAPDRAALAPWIRAAERAHEALTTATALLQPDPAQASQRSRPRAPEPPATQLNAAATAMTLARDLLHTHTGPPGSPRPERSEWAPVVTSVPIARALLYEVAGWARQIAPYGGQLAVAGARGTPQARRNLNAACQWLWVLDWAVQAAHERQPVPSADLQLLHAIPVNALAPRHLPDGGDPVRTLCQGTIETAERVRETARAAIPDAPWSPSLTMESFRQTAAYCTVISHNCATMLRTLATRAARDRATGLSTQLAESAAAADNVRQAWLQAASAWDTITTDSRRAISQTAAEAADLALWTGRLAYADPTWTPQHKPSEAIRPPESLAPSRTDLQHAVAAAHHACHTLTQLATADRHQLRLASITGRLIVPTRSLPDRFDIPHRVAPAPASHTEHLLSAYHYLHATSDQATQRIAEAAATVRAPSQILTTAQNANRPRSPDHQARNRGPTPAPTARRPAIPAPPGPVERILLDLDVTSPAMLNRASALDHAADQLILKAAQTHRQNPVRDPARSAGTAELINHLLASGNHRAAALLHPPESSHAAEPEIEP